MDSDYDEEGEYLSPAEEDETEMLEYDSLEIERDFGDRSSTRVCNFCKHANQETTQRCSRCGRCGTHASNQHYWLQGCKHEVCRDCLLDYIVSNEKLGWVLAYNVNDEKFNGLTCLVPDCRKMLSRQDLRAAAGEHVLEFLDGQALQQVFKECSPYTRVRNAVMVMKEAFDTFKSAGKPQQQLDEALVKGFRALMEGISTLRDEDSYLLEVVVCCDPTVYEVLCWLLRNDSTLDISERSHLYTEMFNFFRMATGKPQLYPLLHKLREGNNDCWMQDLVTMDQESLMFLFEKLHKQATFILSNPAALKSITVSERGFLSESKDVYERLVEHVRIWKVEISTQTWYRDAHDFFTGRWCGILPEFGTADKSGSSSSFKSSKEEIMDYVNALKPKQFGEAKLKERFYFRDCLQRHAENKARSRRVAKEIATLATNLPLEYHSSIHIRVDEERLDVIKALIIGPEETPYENGIFMFDIFLPPEYPEKPPMVQFLTTGGGRIRFNPNLYSSGKVCLSLLGTWSGPAWIPGESTLLQVLVSIQSLVLVAEPYYNEPGAEWNVSASKSYSENQRNNTMAHSMLPALREPDPAFAELIMLHFKLKRKVIEMQCNQWNPTTAVLIKAELASKFDTT